MKNLTKHAGLFEIIERLPNSKNGNPRYLVRVDGWTCRTPVDSSLGYMAQNFHGAIVQAIIGTHYGVSTLASVQKI